MLRLRILTGLLAGVIGSAGFLAWAGAQQVDGATAIDRALKSSSLTTEGTPFHGVMEIGEKGSPYASRIEVWWVNETKYRVLIMSPDFKQTKIVNGAAVKENDEGPYYPRWLENFVLALLHPLPMAKNFQSGTVTLGEPGSATCLRRDDRPSGITDQLTWGVLCLSGPEPRLQSVLTFNDAMEFKDWQRFGSKQIARGYRTSVLAYQPVEGRLTTLEELLHPEEAMFTVGAATPVERSIGTEFVSTDIAAGLIEKAPEIQWPAVREGKTDGYMILYARTDRTGQVRETAKHNSDQPGLESFGMEQALRYKFKPLLVDGKAEQMEFPMVLHFTSRLEDPPPILTAEQMKAQMGSCRVGSLPDGTPKGAVVRVRISVDETGKMTGMSFLGPDGGSALGALEGLRECRFKPYTVNGKVTYYKGDIEVNAR